MSLEMIYFFRRIDFKSIKFSTLLKLICNAIRDALLLLHIDITYTME
jgi:hypothetical protein